MLRCAITSRSLYAGDEKEKQATLLRLTSRWVTDGIDLIQLREKDLETGAIAALARKMLRTIGQAKSPTKLLINSRLDIALATGAHGVHLTGDPDELTPMQVRTLYTAAGLSAPVVTMSCHTLENVTHACRNKASAILFAPVFEKVIEGRLVTAGLGLEQLRAACTAAFPIPVFAMGGVTVENASACIKAGAAGIAGIRLFHHN